jgi:hypothetical protein
VPVAGQTRWSYIVLTGLLLLVVVFNARFMTSISLLINLLWYQKAPFKYQELSAVYGAGDGEQPRFAFLIGKGVTFDDIDIMKALYLQKG